MHRIVITEFMDQAAVDRLATGDATLYAPDLADRQGDIPALLATAEALIVRNRTQVTAALLDAAPGLRVVGRLGVGLDNIDQDACRARDVAVIPATGANDDAVAEYVITAALILLRGAWHDSAAVAAGHWPRQRLIGRELGGKRLGLLGFGAIARKTARLGQALGMAVTAHDPFLTPGDPAWGSVRSVDIETLFATADVLSLHVPLSAETRHVVDAARLSQMPDGSVLINAARGGVVDETALAAALGKGRPSGAALDVFEEEPLSAGAGARFEGLNVLLTPHIAGVTAESNVRVSDKIADDVLAVLNGQ
ncbi:MAG: NAD(P)-dependent oxidoreductase [Pseudomonadota bacterium]